MSGRMRSVLRGAGVVAAGVAVAVLAALSPRGGLVEPSTPPVPPDADAYVAERVARSQALGVWPQATERLVRHGEGKTEVAFLYIHGFGASRGEGEYVVDQLAADWSANAYYTRLPGHGIDIEAHASAEPSAWLLRVAEDLALAQALGDKVVVVGSSTGALLATWLAATYPERVDALVLASPFFDYPGSWTASALNTRGAVHLLQAVSGNRDCRYVGERRQIGYEDAWLEWQHHSALAALEGARRHCSRPEVLAAVSQPVLMMYHYASPDEHDTVVSVDAMREAYAAFNGGDPQAKSRQVVVADSDHVMLSQYVRTDKRSVRMALDVFLNNVLR